MLHSKYLTQEGMEIMLKTLYQNGWRYINRIGQSDSFYVSVEKPLLYKDGPFHTCHGAKHYLEGTLCVLIADALNGYNSVKITDYVDIVDWSTVKVDTPVLVKSVKDGKWKRRYFAFYNGGHVYTWDRGATSWSTNSNENVSWWNYTKLAED